PGNVQIALRELRGPNADGLIGEAHMKGISIGFTVNRDRADAQLFAGTDDAQGDFPAIRNQDLLEHASQCVARTLLSACLSAVMLVTYTVSAPHRQTNPCRTPRAYLRGRT